VSTVVYVGAASAAYSWFVAQKSAPKEGGHQAPFERLAPTYDARMDQEEGRVGMAALRRRVALRARGNVIEVAAGTGRNLSMLPSPPMCTSLTAVESSSAMVDVLKAKASGSGVLVPVTVVQADAAHLPLADASFDTGMETFGLCSYEAPVAALKELARVVKPGGQLLLLEHGRSRYWLVSKYLDWQAAGHKRSWGCDFNRDIGALVREAGLTIVEHEEHHLGTTHLIVVQL